VPAWESLKPHYDILWAPWRMAYIKQASNAQAKPSCIFCSLLREDDEKALILVRATRAYVVMNRFPYNTGHVMVVPYRHVPSLEDLDDDEIREIGLLLKAVIKGLKRALRPHGFNIGINLGSIAGAGIADHFHVHVVPRWSGDTNFMPIIGGTKVIPQSLDETYKEIREPIREEAKRLGLKV